MKTLSETHPSIGGNFDMHLSNARIEDITPTIQNYTRDILKIKEAVDTAMHEVELDAFHPSTKVHLETMRKRILHYLELK